MEEQSTQSSGNKFIPVLIFLATLLVVGAIYLVVNKKDSNQYLQTTDQSGTIDSNVESEEIVSSEEEMEKVTELKIEDEVVGTGTEAISGKTVTVNYLGTLTDGTKFDSSYDRNEPFSFTLGAGEVIEGWDKGVVGMKIGGKRKLTIPSSMAYGDSGISGAIPGGATLVFEVELLKVE